MGRVRMLPLRGDFALGDPFNVVAGAFRDGQRVSRSSLLRSVPPVGGWPVVVGPPTARVASEAIA